MKPGPKPAVSAGDVTTSAPGWLFPVRELKSLENSAGGASASKKCPNVVPQELLAAFANKIPSNPGSLSPEFPLPSRRGNNEGMGDALYFSSLRVIGFMLRIQHAQKIMNVGGVIYRFLGETTNSASPNHSLQPPPQWRRGRAESLSSLSYGNQQVLI